MSAEPAPPNPAPLNRRWRGWFRIALAALGLAGLGYLVHRIGPARLLDASTLLAPWLPLVFAIEGLRIVVDAFTSRLLYGERGALVPWPTLLRVHAIAYPANLLLPGGRAVAEGIKIAELRRYIGLERVAAAAVVGPAIALLGVFLVSLPCLAVAAWRWGMNALSWAIAAQATSAIVAAFGLLFVARRPELGRGVAKLSASIGATTERVRLELESMGFVPLRPLASALANRALLGIEVALFVYAVGARGSALPAAVGVHLVGAAIGDAVPAQLGATDGSMAFAAEPLGLTMASAVAASLAFHAVQLGWVLVGSLVVLVSSRAELEQHHRERESEDGTADP